jgi:hypothetical protein
MTGGRQVLYLDRNFYPCWKALTTACQPAVLRQSNSAPCPCNCSSTCGTRLRSGTCHEACPRRQSARNRRSAIHCPTLFPFPGLTCTARPSACLARRGVQPTLVPFRFCSLPVSGSPIRSIGFLLASSLTRRPAGRASCQPQDNSQRVFLSSHQQHAQRSTRSGHSRFQSVLALGRAAPSAAPLRRTPAGGTAGRKHGCSQGRHGKRPSQEPFRDRR